MEQKQTKPKTETQKAEQKQTKPKVKIDVVKQRRQEQDYIEFCQLYHTRDNALQQNKTPDVKLTRRIEDLTDSVNQVIEGVSYKKAKNTCTVSCGALGSLKMVKDIPIPVGLYSKLKKKHHNEYFV